MSEYVTHDDSGVPRPEFQQQQIVTNETMYRLYNRVARENYSGLTQFATGYIYYIYYYIIYICIYIYVLYYIHIYIHIYICI